MTTHTRTLPAFARQRGFTLVELLLVMATLAVVTAMAMPRYTSSLSHYRVQSAAQRIALDLAAAAADAVAASAPRTITFEPHANGYTIAGVADLERRGADWHVDLTAEPYRATLVSADLGGDGSIVFDGYGAPDSGGTIVVRSGEMTRTITIDADTGRATVK